MYQAFKKYLPCVGLNKGIVTDCHTPEPGGTGQNLESELWTRPWLDSRLDHGLDCGLDHGLDRGLDSGPNN